MAAKKTNKAKTPAPGKGLTAAPPGGSAVPMKWVKIGQQTWKDSTGKRVTSDVDPNTTGAPMWKGQVAPGYTLPPSASSTPAAADPTKKIYTPEEVAAAQSKYNIETAQQQANINRVNEVNPYGSSTYTKNADGSYTRNTNLSAAEQAKLDWQNRTDTNVSGMIDQSMNQVKDAWKNPLNFDDLGKIPQAGDNEAVRARLEKDAVDRYLRNMQPQWDQQKTQFVQEMANRGIPEGSELFNRQMSEFEKQRQQGLLDVTSEAIQNAGAEDTRLFNQNIAARGTAVNERTSLRDRPFQEASQLMASRQGVVNPQFGATPEIQISPVDYTGAFQTYQTTQQRRAESEQQQQQFLADQQFKAEQAALDRANSIRVASRYGGGGGGGDDWLAKAQFNLNAQKELANLNFNNAQSLANNNKPPKNSQLGSTLGNIAGSFAGGLGNSIGSSLFSRSPSTTTTPGVTSRGLGGGTGAAGFNAEGGFLGQPPINFSYNPYTNTRYNPFGR